MTPEQAARVADPEFRAQERAAREAIQREVEEAGTVATDRRVKFNQ